MKHLTWPIVDFENISRVKEVPRGLKEAGNTRYPLRCFRYWFCSAALRQLSRRLGRPVRVLEVGIGRGQMLAFLGGPAKAGGGYGLPDHIAAWVGMDVQVDQAMLARYGFSNYYERNIEQPFTIDEKPFDAIIVLHILEHLLEPEAALQRLLPYLSTGGQLIGGSPTLPHFLAARHEARLRKKAAPRMHDVRLHKHLSAITGTRMRRFAERNGLTVDVLTGAFLTRQSGHSIENSLLWYRANMIWGALFPPLGSEIYFALDRA